MKGRWQVRLLFGENKGKRLTGVVPGTERRGSTGGKGGRGSDMSSSDFPGLPWEGAKEVPAYRSAELEGRTNQARAE